MEWNVAVVAVARDHGRTRVELPDVRHSRALLERARLHAGRRAVDEYARAALLVVSSHYAPDGFDAFRHFLGVSFVSDATAFTRRERRTP